MHPLSAPTEHAGNEESVPILPLNEFNFFVPGYFLRQLVVKGQLEGGKGR